MRYRSRLFVLVSSLVYASCVLGESAETARATPAPAETPARLFAVEIRTGPNWDDSKPPSEQDFFGEHSAHLKRLRDTGHIVMGARYSEVGLLVVSAESADAVRALMARDPSMAAETFRYEVHAFNVFYPGLVQP